VGKKILIVEDNLSSLKLMRDVLVYWGFSIIEARDGEKGVELARSEKPDLILMDVQMPVLDGLSATKLIRESESTRVIPIICVTSDGMRSSREKVLKAGANDFVAKPINIASFVEMIKNYLDEKRTDEKHLNSEEKN
jgi:two-component system, cell cycle response regulator DivK